MSQTRKTEKEERKVAIKSVTDSNKDLPSLLISLWSGLCLWPPKVVLSLTMGGQTLGKSHCCWCWGVELKREAGIPPGWLSSPDASSWSRNLLKVHSVYTSWMVKEPAQRTLSVHQLNGQGTCSRYTQCTSAEWSRNLLKVHSVYISWMVKEPAQSTLSVHQLNGQESCSKYT
jgi:hypothetical protein